MQSEDSKRLYLAPAWTGSNNPPQHAPIMSDPAPVPTPHPTGATPAIPNGPIRVTIPGVNWTLEVPPEMIGDLLHQAAPQAIAPDVAQPVAQPMDHTGTQDVQSPHPRTTSSPQSLPIQRLRANATEWPMTSDDLQRLVQSAPDPMAHQNSCTVVEEEENKQAELQLDYLKECLNTSHLDRLLQPDINQPQPAPPPTVPQAEEEAQGQPPANPYADLTTLRPAEVLCPPMPTQGKPVPVPTNQSTPTWTRDPMISGALAAHLHPQPVHEKPSWPNSNPLDLVNPCDLLQPARTTPPAAFGPICPPTKERSPSAAQPNNAAPSAAKDPPVTITRFNEEPTPSTCPLEVIPPPRLVELSRTWRLVDQISWLILPATEMPETTITLRTPSALPKQRTWKLSLIRPTEGRAMGVTLLRPVRVPNSPLLFYTCMNPNEVAPSLPLAWPNLYQRNFAADNASLPLSLYTPSGMITDLSTMDKDNAMEAIDAYVPQTLKILRLTSGPSQALIANHPRAVPEPCTRRCTEIGEIAPIATSPQTLLFSVHCRTCKWIHAFTASAFPLTIQSARAFMKTIGGSTKRWLAGLQECTQTARSPSPQSYKALERLDDSVLLLSLNSQALATSLANSRSWASVRPPQALKSPTHQPAKHRLVTVTSKRPWDAITQGTILTDHLGNVSIGGKPIQCLQLSYTQDSPVSTEVLTHNHKPTYSYHTGIPDTLVATTATPISHLVDLIALDQDLTGSRLMRAPLENLGLQAIPPQGRTLTQVLNAELREVDTRVKARPTAVTIMSTHSGLTILDKALSISCPRQYQSSIMAPHEVSPSA